MRIVIVGAGMVGTQLAGRLSEEGHDIIVVDRDRNRLRNLEENYDLQTIPGDATSISVLHQAGVEKADLVVAVSNHDATNVLVCKLVAGMDHYGRTQRIARIRSSGCFDNHAVLTPQDMGISKVIYPEKEAAAEITRLLLRPYANQVYLFLGGQVEIISITMPASHPLNGKRIPELVALSPHPFRIVAISSETEAIIPINKDAQIKPGDHLHIACTAEYLESVVSSLGFDTQPLRKVFLYGGSSVGLDVARSLETSPIQVRILDADRNVTKQLAYTLRKALVLHGEGTDSRLLESEGVDESDVFVAATTDENANLLSCLLAKKLGVRRTTALVAKPDYVPLVAQLNVDSLISQRLMTINRIMQQVRRGSLLQQEELEEGRILGLEFRVTNQTLLTDHSLASREFRHSFPKDCIVGGIYRDGLAFIPDGTTKLQIGDRVVVVALAQQIPELEQFFPQGDFRENPKTTQNFQTHKHFK